MRSDRTREFGIRLAVGATCQQVLLQLLCALKLDPKQSAATLKQASEI